MRARSRTITCWIGAGVVALVATACTSPSNPGALARVEQPNRDAVPQSVETLPPVTTTPPLTTTSTPATPTTLGTGPGTIDSSATTEQPPPSSLDLISDRLRGTLGPTNDVGAAIRSVAPFPAGVMTPDEAEIVEVSIGASSATENGTILAQVSVSLTTSLDAAAAFDQMSSALQSAGMFVIDSTTQSAIRSAAFRLPGVGLFDEVVLTTAPDGGGASVRVTSNSDRTTEGLELFVNWADAPLPLPSGDDQRTLVTMSSSGSGRLQEVNLTIESTSIVESRFPQQEANRLISRVDESDQFGFAGDPTVDQPLNGSLIFDGLDSLDYSVAAAVRIEVDDEGERTETEVVEVRLVGERREDS